MSKQFLSLGSPEKHSQRPLLYVQKVKEVNREVRKDMIHTIKELNVLPELYSYIPMGSEIQLFTTGSDGREEKFGKSVPFGSNEVSTSPMEIGVLLDKTMVDTQNIIDIERSLISHDIFGEAEVKVLKKDTIATYRDNPQVVWPTRLIDAKALSTTYVKTESGFDKKEGKSSLISSAHVLLGDVVADSSLGFHLTHKVRDQMKFYKRIINAGGKGKYRHHEIINYSIDDGLLYYDPSIEARLGSVKYGPLRYIQLLLAYKIVRAINDKQVGPSLISEVGTQTRNKIYTLTLYDILPLKQTEATALADLYEYFLWCYFLSVFRYIVDKQTVVEIPDRTTFAQAFKDLQLLKRAAKL